MKTRPYEYVEFVLVYLAEIRSSISFLHMQIQGLKEKNVLFSTEHFQGTRFIFCSFSQLSDLCMIFRV